MKIGIVTPIERRTGISTYSIILAAHLSKFGEEVTLVSSDNSYPVKDTIPIKNVKVIPINQAMTYSLNFDILHIQFGNSQFHEYQLHYLNKFKEISSSVITTVHDPRNFKALNLKCSKCLSISINKWIHHPIMPPWEVVDVILKRISKALIFHSENLMKKYISKYDYTGHASVIPLPGYRTNINKLHDEYKNTKLIGLDNIRKLVVPGYISPFKGVDIIIEALGEIDDKFELILLGGINNRKYAKYLKEIIQKNKLGEKVKFTGFVDEQSFGEELDKAYIILVPRLISPWYKKSLPYNMRKIIKLSYNLDQSTSAALTEALTAGKAIICSKTPGFSEYINEERGILCENTIKSWKEAIQYLLNNPEAVKEMSKQSKKFANEKINPERTARKHINVYKKVLENN